MAARDVRASEWTWVPAMGWARLFVDARQLMRIEELSVELLDAEDRPGVEIDDVRIGTDSLVDGPIPTRAMPVRIDRVWYVSQRLFVDFRSFRSFGTRARFVVAGRFAEAS